MGGKNGRYSIRGKDLNEIHVSGDQVLGSLSMGEGKLASSLQRSAPRMLGGRLDRSVIL